jgi:hypothetical protein
VTVGTVPLFRLDSLEREPVLESSDSSTRWPPESVEDGDRV